jgi:very-short-patch-repair endonuclease
MSTKRLEINLDVYSKHCASCRTYKICPVCKLEFNHYQNQTCSNECSSKLKRETYIQSTGKPHNFCKGSSSRSKWESNMLEEHGISNIFQREDIKRKLKDTWTTKYGVDNPSKSEEIKFRKKITLAKTLEDDPELFKRKWKITHENYMNSLGYDPRLINITQTSKESLDLFYPLIEYFKEYHIKFFAGIENNREFCIRGKDQSYFYDLCIPDKKIIIEYNGTAWHAKEFQLDYSHPITKENYESNYQRNFKKIELAKSKGFEVIVIWSDDLNKKEKINHILKRIIYENQINN